MSEMVTLWLVVLIVSIGVEVATLGLTSIWFAGGAVVAVIAAALQAPIWLQILLFFAVSLLLFVFSLSEYHIMYENTILHLFFS